jgi:hypothetical protein
MPKNSLSDLRNHLFATLEALTEESPSSLDLPLKIEKAKAVAEVAQTIINSAKLEVDYIKATGQEEAKSEFLEPERRKAEQPKLLPPVANGHNGNGHGKGLSTGKTLGAAR